jgi:hypothetical protein
MFIDFRELNKETRKDHYPLRFINQTLERLVESFSFCYFDGKYGVSKIIVHSDDQLKTTFTSPFELYAYRCMPFRLCNAPATFQRCMTSIFVDFIKDIMEVFMDDIFIYGTSFNL